ncbi:ABC transporter permease [Klugiella xanthotipulae]|uniref:Putative ABC transport system permease protein n=1 Tax=Klugiella xanthotipulae TaxID=244735 RepID=A0A543HH58_9MICO|nr:ABC transporter permease [Klugiella xanthotipulae]TQM57666.1 putative ABC transport system permease protein [Klugiella xanthotipulae]
MIAALELGLIYAVMALGVYLTFRILNFPDLTVDGSFTTGAAVAAMLITNGVPPLLATGAGFVGGMLAGLVTGLLHTKGKINGLLAGILTMIALYSINLKIMGGTANLALTMQGTLFTPLADAGILDTGLSLVILFVGAFLIKLVIDWFLHTDVGLAAQATGDNEQMVRSFGVSTDTSKILLLMLSNGLVALCGALIAQYQGAADISMGVGLILVGLASVIIGNALVGTGRGIFITSLSVIVGAVLYRLIIFLALDLNFDPNDMKLISAVIVVIALLLPRLIRRRTPRALPAEPTRSAVIAGGTQ